jgi:two-component system, NtrC family, sensor kinase
MAIALPTTAPSRWELAAELIAVKIRWFGLIIGYVLVNVDPVAAGQRPVLNAILALGGLYALLDTYQSYRGRVFLGRYPLIVSIMEALFIGLLCYFQGGLESYFRYYYLLSLICCAIRYSSRLTFATCGLHCASYTLLYLILPVDQRSLFALVLMLVLLGWVTWAGDSMSLLLKHVGEHLARLNTALQENQSLLETRIEERTLQLQEAQAHLLHQEKMAAFGLLAAGIAHEVGNPLTSISSLVQMLERRDCDDYTRERLGLVGEQLQRIQKILRELVTFSRPANTERSWVSIADILQEALNIAKYYKGTKSRSIEVQVSPESPRIYGVRDQLVQIFFNLVLNAVDATQKGGRIRVSAEPVTCNVEVRVWDDGCGIAPEDFHRLFQPYFTTKKHGTGLGLFVSRKLVADHGGTIDFESKSGKETIFRVRLPAKAI